jgi:lipoate-protein ligase A
MIEGFKMRGWRLLDLEFNDPYLNMSLEEALFNVAEDVKKLNTLRLWRNVSAVVIGRFQDVSSVVNIDECLKRGISILRRFTGGGAVYQDYGNLNWTVVVFKDDFSYLTSLTAFYDILGGIIINSLKSLRLSASFEPPNVIQIGKKKISGMSMKVGKRCVLCHGTLLVNSNIDILPQLLKNMRTEVTTIQQEYKDPISISFVKSLLINTFQNYFRTSFKRGTLTKAEEALLHKLYKEKYLTVEWNLNYR